MAPGNNERHPGHTGTIPKTKARNNCNVPQEAVTPTRRDMASNLVSTSLDWVPVSEYNSRSNYNQSRKQTNNTSDQELNDLENSVSFESGFGRFVPVRPQPRALPLNVQNRENLTNDHQDDGSSMSGHTLHPYAHQMQNGLVPHSNHANHAAAAVMIVNPTTPNAVTANMSQPFNAPNQNRKNLTNNLNPARNNFDGNHSSNNNANTAASNSRTGTKTVNLMNNMYDQGQPSMNNVNENNHVHRESARALGEAIVAACPDTAAVERRLGQIREYIRVTSSLVDTMRNSEDEAFIEHTKEEYDELVEMVMKLKESETKLEKVLNEEPDNVEVPAEEADDSAQASNEAAGNTELVTGTNVNENETGSFTSKQDTVMCINNLKKVTNLENEQLNKSLQSVKNSNEHLTKPTATDADEIRERSSQISEKHESEEAGTVEIKEVKTIPYEDPDSRTHDHRLNEVLRKNIISCVEKVALIEEMKNKNNSSNEDQEVVVRPVSAQSNGSTYSENELWQNEIKNKMELSQRRLTALKQQQKRLLKYQEEAKQQLEEINRERQSQESVPSTSHDNFGGMQGHPMNGNNYNHRMYAANQIGVATTLPHSNENVASRASSEHGHSNQDDRFSHRDTNIASSEEAAGGGRDSDAEDDSLLTERGRMLQVKLRELQLKKQHMENLVSEFQKLQMATQVGSNNTYSSSGEESADDEPSRKCNKSGGNIKNEDPFKLMEIKAIKTALQKTKDLMRSVENYESDNLSGLHEDTYQMPSHSNINDNKSEGGGSIGGWSNEGSVCRVRNSLPQRHKFTNEQHSQQHMQQAQQHPLQHQQHQQQHLQHLQQHTQQMQHPQQMSHESNIASLQELAQELRMETEKIVGERARIKDMLSNKEMSRKPKKVNEQASTSGWVAAGPAERRQMQLRTLLADKQRELDKLLNKEKVLSGNVEAQKMKADSCTASIITGINQSYNSEQEEPDSRSEQILLDSQNSRDTDNFRAGDSALGARSHTGPSQLGSAYCSDSDSASRTKSNQRSRVRRRQTQERLSEDNNVPQSNNSSQHSLRHEPRAEPSNVNLVPPTSQNIDNPINMPYPHMPPPYWSNTNKTNQDMRTNQFTQNSHSQTMERLLGTPQMSFPPSMPFNMMMPYGGMVGGCGCGCGLWGAWCWQQLLLQQRELHALRDQLTLVSIHTVYAAGGMVGGCGCGCGLWGAWCWQQLLLQQRELHALRDQLTLVSIHTVYAAGGMVGGCGCGCGLWGAWCWQQLLLQQRELHALRDQLTLVSIHTVYAAGGMVGGCGCGCGLWGAWCWQQLLLQQRELHALRDQLTLVSIHTVYAAGGMVGGCGCGCGLWGAWCWQQLLLQQRELHALRDQLTLLEERWRVETASHTLNNQVPPGNRANNYWDNFRSYSRQNLLSVSSKTNADGAGGGGNGSGSGSGHNALRRAPPPPKRNTEPSPGLRADRASFCSAPDVLNLNQDEPADERHLNAPPVPEIVQAHSINLQDKRKSSSKLPAKNSRPSTSNIDLAGSSRLNPNLASARPDTRDKAASKLFDLLRENVYSEVTALIGVNESHPDFLIQLFKELQLISSDPLRQRVLQSIRNVLSQYGPVLESQSNENREERPEGAASATSAEGEPGELSLPPRPSCSGPTQFDNDIVRFLLLKSEEICTPELLDALATQILNGGLDGRRPQISKKRLLDFLSKYEGINVCSVSNDIIESLPLVISGDGDESGQLSESSILQDVAGSLNLFSSSDSQLHCPYDMWPGHVHVDMDGSTENSPRSSQEGKVDLINCSEMHNGDLAEADQSRAEDSRDAPLDALPDVVDTEEPAPTEADAEWLGLDRVPTRLHMGESSEKQKD